MLPRYENKLSEIRSMISTLLLQIIHSSEETLLAFENNQNELYETARNYLKSLQSDANKIDNEIIKTFALFGPEADELRLLVSYLKMTNELDRIGDGMRKYSKRLEEHLNGGIDLSILTSTIIQLHKTTINALHYIHQCLEIKEGCDAEELYRKVMVEESKNDDLFSIMEKELLTLVISSGELSVEYVKVLGTLRKLERSGDRAVNIAALLLYAQKGGEMQIYN
ncbi:MAG: PhoU family transcriptional regulator [Sulfuricurvum sp.]|jgi:phosphate transport system protein|uniref:phosphate signaling complex PhoU family protein n=1 Tax=Sulfuricurvum sp. TaxID=2025608 RepID=UPI0025D3CA5E|nr:PhoU domain-containing protein [Sulfuricurvum sp.]MCK9371965.1 PhoU family transcriptional regulator [Sulfuricurvum sp.]